MTKEESYYKKGLENGLNDDKESLGYFEGFYANQNDKAAAQRGWEAGQSARAHNSPNEQSSNESEKYEYESNYSESEDATSVNFSWLTDVIKIASLVIIAIILVMIINKANYIAKSPPVVYVQPMAIGLQDYATMENVWTAPFKSPWQKTAWRVGINVPYYEVRINQRNNLIFRFDPKGGDKAIDPSINVSILEFKTPSDSRVVIYEDH